MSQRVSPLTTIYLLSGVGSAVGAAGVSTTGAGGGGASVGGAGAAATSLLSGWAGASVPSIRLLPAHPIVHRAPIKAITKKAFELRISSLSRRSSRLLTSPFLLFIIDLPLSFVKAPQGKRAYFQGFSVSPRKAMFSEPIKPGINKNLEPQSYAELIPKLSLSFFKNLGLTLFTPCNSVVNVFLFRSL